MKYYIDKNENFYNVFNNVIVDQHGNSYDKLPENVVELVKSSKSCFVEYFFNNKQVFRKDSDSTYDITTKNVFSTFDIINDKNRIPDNCKKLIPVIPINRNILKLTNNPIVNLKLFSNKEFRFNLLLNRKLRCAYILRQIYNISLENSKKLINKITK